MTFNGNWVDLIILVVCIFFIIEGFRVGFWVMLADFVSFLGSLLISLKTYTFIANVLKDNFSLSRSLSNAIGFLLTAIIVESFLGFIFAKLIKVLPKKTLKLKSLNVLSVVPAVGEALVLLSFILLLLISFPVNPSIKKDVTDSKIGGYLINKTVDVETKLKGIFGGIIEESLTYFTVKPGSRESIPISNEKVELKVDEISETEMFRKVNEERRKRGISELQWDPEVVPVARAHATDMWERGYFGHVSPEGEDVGDRLDKANIKYSFAGENLALAPTVQTAHTGLMNSEGHRENILEPRFKKVGIGVVDNGFYGKMFVQVFKD